MQEKYLPILDGILVHDPERQKFEKALDDLDKEFKLWVDAIREASEAVDFSFWINL